MSTDRQGGKIIFECDACDETFEGDEHEDFSDAWARAKREGWTTRKRGQRGKEEWMHGCARHDA